MKDCPTEALCWASCRKAAAWIASNANSPCRVSTNAMAAPLLFSHIAVQLAITVSARAWHVSKMTSSVVFSYRCIRACTHVSEYPSLTAPTLYVSALLAGGDVLAKAPQRKPPAVHSGCPFIAHLRITLPPQFKFSSPSIPLDELVATLEFPNSPGYHGGTHEPDLRRPLQVGGATVAQPPRRDGEVDDSYIHPLHPDALRFVYSMALSEQFDSSKATALVQTYLNWLHPLFVDCPDIVSAPLPPRVLMRSSGSAPIVCLRNEDTLLIATCDPIDSLSEGTSEPASESLSAQARVACLVNPASEDAEAGFRGCTTSRGILGHSSEKTTPDSETPIEGALESAVENLLSLAEDDTSQHPRNTLLLSLADALAAATSEKTSIAEALRILHQQHAYSCFSWLAPSDVISSIIQWGA
jgi:hypothetical protein